jgi:predicted signal transduction protein with EAL and GGDEF domain
MRPKDCVARLGGDEFGIILRDVTDPSEILWRVRAVIPHEMSVSGLSLSVDSSVGFVGAPPEGSDVDNPAHDAIVRPIVDLGHNLHFHAVGEGVESIETRSRLRDSGCDSAQGYLIAFLMPLEELGS